MRLEFFVWEVGCFDRKAGCVDIGFQGICSLHVVYSTSLCAGYTLLGFSCGWDFCLLTVISLFRNRAFVRLIQI